MKYTVIVEVDVEADCSRAALARVLGCITRDLGEFDVAVEPDDGDITDDGSFVAAEGAA